MKILLLIWFIVIAFVIMTGCKTPAPVTMYYIGFRPTGKPMQLMAMPERVKGWVVVDSVKIKQNQ